MLTPKQEERLAAARKLARALELCLDQHADDCLQIGDVVATLFTVTINGARERSCGFETLEEIWCMMFQARINHEMGKVELPPATDAN